MLEAKGQRAGWGVPCLPEAGEDAHTFTLLLGLGPSWVGASHFAVGCRERALELGPGDVGLPSGSLSPGWVTGVGKVTKEEGDSALGRNWCFLKQAGEEVPPPAPPTPPTRKSKQLCSLGVSDCDLERL